MRKHFLLSALLLICPLPIFAHDFEVDGIYYNFLGGDSVEVTYQGSSYGYDGNYSGSVTILETVLYNSTTYRVTAIGEHAFHDCSKLTSITIPNSVTTIGDWAFESCSGLTSVTIPDSVTTIGRYVFYYCSGLTSITIPNSVTSIGSSAFYYCSGLTSITIPNSVTTIGERAFSHCFGLETITVEVGNPTYHSAGDCIIETATNTLHTGCKNSIIPTDGSVTTIGDYAFSECPGLTSVTIPNSVTSIGGAAFYNCKALTSITIPNSVTTIDDEAFAYCFGLTSVIIGNSVTTIGDKAFDECYGLTSVTIGNSVTTIGDYAFSECPSLTSITIPNSVTSIGKYAFDDCFSLQYNTHDDAKYLGNTENPYHALIEVPTNVTSCAIHEKTKVIAGGAFSECSGLTSITIPNSVTSIGGSAFYNCKALTSITIPNSVTTISESAFYNCSGLTSITIPNSVTSIGGAAFYNCKALTSITIPNSVTTIGDKAFASCSGLTSITIPNSVTSIGSDAFLNCSKLKEITLGENITSIGDNAFKNCSNLTKVTCWAAIPPTITSTTYPNSLSVYVWVANNREAYQTAPYWADMKIGSFTEFTANNISYKYLSEDELTIIYYNRDSNDDTNDVSIPSLIKINNIDYHITTINEKAFYQCTEITSIKIPNSVTKIGESAFDGCTKLRSLQIGDGLTEYPEKAFANCTGLLNLTVLAETPPYVQANTFENVSRSLLVHVPCSALGYYKAAYYWNEFTNYQEGMVYSFSATSAQKTQGKVTIHQRPDCESEGVAIFEAIPYQGYEFSGWNDGNLEPYRIVEVTEDVEYTASFVSTTAGEKTDSVIVNPSNNSAEFIWPAIEGANTYVFVIYVDEARTDKICTLTCNKYGQLTNIDFTRNKPAAHQEEPFGLLNFTVTGLESATTYGYALNSYDTTDALIKSDVGVFRTTSATTGVENVTVSTDSICKVFENGTIYILRNGEKYTLDGRKVE